MCSSGTKPNISDQRYRLFSEHFLSKSKIYELNSMRIMASHHIFWLQISVKDFMLMKYLQGCEHLIGDESNGLDVEIPSIFFENAIKIIIKFLHNHI